MFILSMEYDEENGLLFLGSEKRVVECLRFVERRLELVKIIKLECDVPRRI